MEDLKEIIDIPYDCSRARVKSEDGQRTTLSAAQRGIYSTPREATGLIMEIDEFKRLKDDERSHPLP